MGIVSVNLLAVVVCAIVNMVLGALWYSPILFANSWMNLIGKSKEEMSNPGPAKRAIFFQSGSPAGMEIEPATSDGQKGAVAVVGRWNIRNWLK